MLTHNLKKEKEINSIDQNLLSFYSKQHSMWIQGDMQRTEMNQAKARVPRTSLKKVTTDIDEISLKDRNNNTTPGEISDRKTINGYPVIRRAKVKTF